MAGEPPSQRPSQRYQLGGRIGGGGMAEVFEATLVGAEGFLRPVAVKRIQPSLSSDTLFGQMFINEARIASLLHHANIAAVLDFDRDEEGRYFLVMELIRGVDLRRLMDSGPLPVSIAVHVAAEMLRGLDYAHELEHEGQPLGIVHRDISPHNVMLSWDGAVKLVDFGIAKVMAATGISRTGTVKGKVAYMSPEQASAAELDGRTDVFAVGVVLHEILVGQRLFRGTTEPEILARLLTQPIARPSELAPQTPPDLDAVVMGMLERNRDARFPTAHAALEALLATSGTSPRAGLELEELLTARFPEQAPRRRGAAPAGPLPVRPALGTPVHPVNPLTTTMPAGPAGIAAALAGAGAETVAARPAAAAAPGRWASPLPETVTADRSPVIAVDPPVERRARRRLRLVALAALSAVTVSAGFLLAQRIDRANRDSGEPAAPSVSPVAPAVDRAAAKESAPAGPVGAAKESPPAAPAVATEPRGAAAEAEAPSAPSAASGSPAEAGRSPVEAPVAPSAPAAASEPAAEAERSGRDARRGAHGLLDVMVDPWADVIVDGVSRGQTPAKISLTPGMHRVVLRNRELGKSETVRVKIRSRATTSIDRRWQ